MTDLLPFIVTGVAIGGVYGLAATGLVLTYKTSGIFNFGHGAVATAGAYVYYAGTEAGWSWPVSLTVAVLGVGIGLGLLLDLLASSLSSRPVVLQVVGTLGIVLLIQGIATMKYGSTTIRIEPFLPHATEAVDILGVAVTWEKVYIFAIAVAAVAALSCYFRLTFTGLLMRGLVEDSDLLSLQGVSPHGLRRLGWIIGSTFAALSGALLAPLIGLNAVVLTLTVAQAFAAAAIGRFTSITATFVGGIVVGVVVSLGERFSFDVQWASGLPDSLPFVILIAVLVARGKSLKAPRTATTHMPSPYRAPVPFRLAAGIAVLSSLLLVPSVVGPDLPYYTSGLTTGCLLLSLGLLVRTSGQVSLCHTTFAAIGAVSFSQLHLAGVPWVASMLLAGLIAVPVGVLVALPALRLSDIFLALATFGFGLFVQQLLFPQEWMFGHLASGREMPLPGFADQPDDFYYLVVLVFAAMSVGLVAIERGRMGRLLRGLGDSPLSMEATGLNIAVLRGTVFCISAFLAGIAGVLLGVQRGYATTADPFFSPTNSLLLVAIIILVPFAEPWFAVVAAASFVVPAYVDGPQTSNILNIVFGASAILVCATGGNPTMTTRFRNLFDRWSHPAPYRTVTRSAKTAPSDGGLDIRNLTVYFGGTAAVESLSLSAPTGRITGLIGPNGAGKTTTFDACSGINTSVRGGIRLGGRNASRWNVSQRARNGLGRSFQVAQLCESLSVVDNVRLGHEAAIAGRNPLRQLVARRRAWDDTCAAADAAMEACGIVDLADVQVSVLSTGQRRLVELARCLAGDFAVLLLDEPASGLDSQETRKLGEILKRAVAERGVGVLLVEHDIDLVADICDHLVVIDAGRFVFEGDPASALRHPEVVERYLGAHRLDDKQRAVVP